MSSTIDPSTRLRRAIHLKDLIIVRRIVKNNPKWIKNPDFDDRNNSSLHLAARLGDLETVKFLIEAGHEDDGITKNIDGNTPLMEAIDANQEETAAYIARSFIRCIDWKNHDGLDALMLSSRSGLADLIPLLLSLYSSPSTLLAATDNNGNTALHFASGYGSLKCLRVLLTAGADPMAENNFRCTPAMGSRTKDAGIYFLSLVREIEVRKLEGREREKEMVRRREGGVRVVSDSSSIGQAIGGEEGEEGMMLEGPLPPARAVFGSVDSGRQSPAGRVRRGLGEGWATFGVPNRSRAGSYERDP